MKLPKGYKCWTDLYSDIRNKHLDQNRQVSFEEIDPQLGHKHSINLNVNDIKSNAFDEMFDLILTHEQLLMLKNKFEYDNSELVADMLHKIDHLMELCYG